MTAALGAQWIYLLCSLALFGCLLFPLYCGAAGATARFYDLRRLAPAVLVSGISTVVAHADAMQTPLSALPSASFGQVWLAQLACAVGVTALIFAQRTGWLATLISGAQLASFAFTGHANAIAGTPGAIVEGAHLLAAGGWLGGLVSLYSALRYAPSPDLVRRFSRAGIAFVVTIGVTGVLILRLNTGAALPMDTPYGARAWLKIALFAAALALAAFNRSWLTPRGAWRTLARVALGELALLLAIVAVAVSLADTQPY